MNYLFSYLHTLAPVEREQLGALPLRPRERETLAALLEIEGEKVVTKEVATARLAMSSSMFDKTCSIVLRRVYDAIVPGGGLALLRDLHGRGLHQHLLHELRAQEREVGKRGAEEQARFYRELFSLLHERFTMHYDPLLAARIARRLGRLDPSARLSALASMLGMEIWRAAAGEANPAVDAGLLRSLQGLQRRVDRGGNARARYQLLRSWIIYYGQIDCQANLRAEALDLSIALCREHSDQLDANDLLSVQLIRAEHEYFFGSSHRAAYDLYRLIFEQSPHELERQGYHRAKYIQLAMILGEYREVEDLLQRFSAPADDPDTGRAKGSAMAWAKLYLVTGRYRKARQAIDLAFELNQKRFFVQFEIECRLLLTAWCVLSGDIDTAEQLVPAHLKYLRSKGYTLGGESLYPWFFKLVAALVEERHTRTPLPRPLERKYEEFQQGAAAQYGAFLRMMRRN